MTNRDRDANIAELLMRTGVYAESFGKPMENLLEGYMRIVRYISILYVDVNGEDTENACKSVLKIAGACEKFIRTFAADEMLWALLLDSELPEEVPDGL